MRTCYDAGPHFDACGPALAEVLCERPTLVKVNADEAAEVVGFPVGGPDSALTACLQIRDMIGGDGHAVGVTLGEHGAVIVDPSGEARLLTLDVLGAYPVGSGDAFLAGLVVVLIAVPWPFSPLAGRPLLRSY